MVMTKYTVVEKLQSDLGFPKKQALETVESLLELIKASLESGDCRRECNNVPKMGTKSVPPQIIA